MDGHTQRIAHTGLLLPMPLSASWSRHASYSAASMMSPLKTSLKLYEVSPVTSFRRSRSKSRANAARVAWICGRVRSARLEMSFDSSVPSPFIASRHAVARASASNGASPCFKPTRPARGDGCRSGWALSGG